MFVKVGVKEISIILKKAKQFYEKGGKKVNQQTLDGIRLEEYLNFKNIKDFTKLKR